MIESDFRDWIRAQLRQLDERVKQLAAKLGSPAPPPPPDQRVQGDIAGLLAKLTESFKDGKVSGLAIVFVTDEGTTMTGFAAENGYFALAGAATFLGLEILEDYRKQEAANDRSADSPVADPATAA
jgi:hypothetical protein